MFPNLQISNNISSTFYRKHLLIIKFSNIHIKFVLNILRFIHKMGIIEI